MTSLPGGAPFGRYLIGERLAAGGMGEVFLAVQTGVGHFNRPLALKLLLPHLDEEPAAIQMFLDEAQLAARMNHPAIVQIFDVGLEQGRYFIAMELVRGISVSRLIRELSTHQERLDPGLIQYIGRCLCEGLHHAHELRAADGSRLEVVHRDVSPQNVLVSQTGEVKLTDFGIAKARDSKARTSPGLIKGKTEYLAPEQIDGQPVDRRADLYGAALTLFQLATLRSPFARPTDLAMMRAVVSEPLPPLRELRPDLPEALVAAIERAASKRPADRFASARDFRDALPEAPSDAAERLGPLVARLGADALGELERKATRLIEVTAPALTDPEVRSRRSGWRLAGLGGVGAGGVMLLGWWLAGPRFERAPATPPLTASRPAPVDAGAPTLPPAPVTPPATEPAEALSPPPVQRAKRSPQLGYLTVDADPWATVFVDGKKLGDTPIAGYPLAPGEVVVVWKNPDTGKTRRRTVKILSGKRHYLRETLR